MSRVRKVNDALANAKAIIEKELAKILVKQEINDQDRGFTLQAFKLLSDDPAASKPIDRPMKARDDEDLLKIAAG